MFYNKYIKYKYKYNQIKNKQYGGVGDVIDSDEVVIDINELVGDINNEPFSFDEHNITNITEARRNLISKQMDTLKIFPTL